MFNNTIVSIAAALALALTLTAASDTDSRFQLVASPESPTAAGTTATSHITATVVDANGSPIEGAVVVTSEGGQGISDHDGIARVLIEGVPSNREAHVTAVATIDGVNHIGSIPTTLHHRSDSDRETDAGAITLNAAGECNPAWIPTFGRGNADKRIRKLIVFDDGRGDGPAIYAGGGFTVLDDVELNYIARWNGVHWEPVGGGMNDWVYGMMVHDDGSGPKLYAVGRFTMAGGVEANRVAMWDGEAWHPIGLGVDNPVLAITAFDDGLGDGPALYIGGIFNNSGETYTSHLARWDGEAWSTVGEIGSDTRKYIWAMKVFDDGAGDGPALFIGGHFDEINGEPANNVARWNGIEWSTLGPGLDANFFSDVVVYSFGSFDDGSGDGPALYAGGNFHFSGEITVNGVAKWNGKTETWSALDNGVGTTGRAVVSLTVHDDGSGFGPALYAAGIIDAVNGVPVNDIARWDGQQWSPVGGGLTEDFYSPVFTLLSYDDGTGDGSILYAGGEFSHAEDVEVDGFAAWNGESWSGIGNGLEFVVRAFTVFDDGSGNGPALYAGGWFTVAGGSVVNNVARWDGVSWSALGSGLDNQVHAMTVFDDGAGDGPALYVGGSFTTAGDVEANRIAKWDGMTWSALGSGMSGPFVRALLAVFDDDSGGGPALYAGGNFSMAGSAQANRIAKWDGTTWSALGSGLDSSMNTMTVFDDGAGVGPALYVGGGFSTAGDVEVNRIAKWDGASWSALGSGMDGTVTALQAFDDGSGDGPALYAGGLFTTAGDVEANRIAKWDGTTWSALGNGIDGSSVSALAVFDSGSGGGPALYAGGFFSMADDVAVNNVAAWDGTSWSTLGSGTSGGITAIVTTLSVFDDGAGHGPALYAGGFFTIAGGMPAVHIAKWQGCPAEPECALADLNCDSVVDVDDLFILLAAWGKCADPDDCPADLDDDGVVDVDDLFILLANWG